MLPIFEKVGRTESYIMISSNSLVNFSIRKTWENMRIYKYMNIFLLKVLPHIAKSNLSLIHALMIKKCYNYVRYRSNRPEVFLGKSVPKICSKFTEEHQSVISIEFTHYPKCDFNKVAKQILNLQYIFGTLFLRTPLEDCFPQVIIYDDW